LFDAHATHEAGVALFQGHQPAGGQLRTGGVAYSARVPGIVVGTERANQATAAHLNFVSIPGWREQAYEAGHLSLAGRIQVYDSNLIDKDIGAMQQVAQAEGCC